MVAFINDRDARFLPGVAGLDSGNGVVKSRRATPQLSLPLGPPSSEPRRVATSDFIDDSPFDPSEFDAPELPRARSAPAPRPAGVPLLPETPRPPVRRTRTHVAVPYEKAQHLASSLRVLVGRNLKLHVHDNRSTMVSFRHQDDSLHLRIHHMFLEAGPEVVRALADYARARSARAGRVLDQFVRQHRGHIRPIDIEQVRARALQSRGQVHDLRVMYDDLNQRYFGAAIDARIGWGRGTSGRRRRSIRMGAYYHETKTILIHPALDRVEVPRYFVELVVYHEMLHQAVPQKRTDAGRRCIHSPEFRARERLFQDFERARAWERRHLPILLRPPRQYRTRAI